MFSPEYDKALFKNGEMMYATVLSTLRFYDAIPEDMRKAFEQFKKFASRVDEADRFDERHLLPIATEIFGTNSFPLHTEYIALPNGETVVFSSPPEEWPLRATTALFDGLL